MTHCYVKGLIGVEELEQVFPWLTKITQHLGDYSLVGGGIKCTRGEIVMIS